MKLFRAAAEPVLQPVEPEPMRSEVLHDRGLLAEWYVLYRLDEEMRRSRRAGHYLTVAVLRPALTAAREGANLAVLAGAQAAQTASRSGDLVGWLGDSIVIIMPDTNELGARVAVRRWQSEMWLKTASAGGLKWLTAIVPDAGRFGSAAEALALENAAAVQIV